MAIRRVNGENNQQSQDGADAQLTVDEDIIITGE